MRKPELYVVAGLVAVVVALMFWAYADCRAMGGTAFYCVWSIG